MIYKGDAIKYNYMLNKKGIRSSDLHSDISQAKRQRILEDFRRGRLQVLVVSLNYLNNLKKNIIIKTIRQLM